MASITVNIGRFKGKITKLRSSFKRGTGFIEVFKTYGKKFAQEAENRLNDALDPGDSNAGFGELADAVASAFSVVVQKGKSVGLIFPDTKKLNKLKTSKSEFNPRVYPSYWKFVRYGFGIKANPKNVRTAEGHRYIRNTGETSTSQGYISYYFMSAPTETGARVISPFMPEDLYGDAHILRIHYNRGFEGIDFFDESDKGLLNRRTRVVRAIDKEVSKILASQFKKRGKKKRGKRR